MLECLTANVQAGQPVEARAVLALLVLTRVGASFGLRLA